MNKKRNRVRSVMKSGFVRSVYMRIMSIFVVAIVAIAGVGFYSFATEIKRNVLSDRSDQLSLIEETVSKRMEEITSIAYNVGNDPAFYIGAPSEDRYSGYEMSSTLARYLVGNNFIEHLAFYRLSEPDKIYVSSGERSLSEFFCSSFGLEESVAQERIAEIKSVTKVAVAPIRYNGEENSFFAYIYPLPELSAKPQAYVLMLISMSEVTPLFEPVLANTNDCAIVFDSEGKEIYRTETLPQNAELGSFVTDDARSEEHITVNGTKHVFQKVVSDTNGWIYISGIREADTLPGLAGKQLVVIILLMLLVLAITITMLVIIAVQYKPINSLAAKVAEGSAGTLDEREVLSKTFETLKGDSKQKQHFESAYHEAEAASRAKSAFLSNMSHDIRTPLNAIIGMTAIALRNADDADYVRDCLQKVKVSSQYLLDIINNVLDMSRIESGRITISNDVIDITRLVDGIGALLESSVEAKSLRLHLNIGKISNSFVKGDSIRLTQAFVNIVSNSIKFTPEGGDITVSMCQKETADAQLGEYVFEFSDTGIGMTPEFVTHVFDTFSRAKNPAVASIEGTGLGMAIAKNLIELMGGTISCRSELGKGTCFTVIMRLPFAQSEETAQEQISLIDDSEPCAPRLEGKRILLVEDNEINREIAHNIINETGAEVIEAVDGSVAVEVFGNSVEGYFDLIFMDIQMPVMNGYDATAAIRISDRNDALTVPIYAMTANTFDEDVRQVKDAGMDGHIGKPYTPEALYRVLRQALCKQ